eukprot:CAMPEP_0117009914 /NCGR_PEP_ID=MMETSP0472-20121206/8877_1 /TAXON_ID=693140 ORGANISM="Tiarina fusus, Strain LIS" /NCGR_SAMPLE_ID=MMETSP0472 /ASSEMBLY_ACC=CAM_ASM_000603 /LENGTH=546 /DNA_ID=CAMNT_0004712325 /DNA_START=130 /DNA_END=1767 /DNA_ORIENTATION=+
MSGHKNGFRESNNLQRECLLLLRKNQQTTVLETTLTLESFNMSPTEINIIKRELSDIISRPGQTKGFLFSQDTVKSLTFGKCLYLLSVYHLETLRAGCGNMLVLFSYLGEQSYRTDIAMSQAITIIADQVFQVFLGEMSSQTRAPVREKILIELIYALLLAFVHNDDTVRKAADKYILQLLDAFPQLLWNRKALTTLLDLTQAVGNGAAVQGHATLRLNLPNSTETITLPEDFVGRKSLLNDISELCTVWLRSAKKYAPVETDSVLQEYCQQFQHSSFGFLHHQGFSLIVQLAANQDTGTDHQSNFSSRQTASSFVNSLNLKSVYLGEVGGMVQISKQLQNDIGNLEEILGGKLKDTLSKLSEGESIDQNTFNGDLCRAAAFVISQKSVVYRYLLHYICWAPIVAFKEESVETGIFVWTWLLAARPDLSALVMHEIKDAWDWSIRHDVGLFNSSVIPPSPLSIPKTGQDSYKITESLRFYEKAPSDPKPHCLLIDFLQERVTLVRKNDSCQMSIIQQMLLNSIADPSKLSQQPNSLAVRFRLLLLC